MTCAYPVWVGFGPVHLANELGYFEEEGITVEEILDDDMPNAIAAMERGDIDCYLRTVGEYQGLGRRKDTQGIIIGTIDMSTGGDGWAADGSIRSVCDLEGKTIAVEPNLPARLILQEALRRECDLSIRDTNLIDIAAADAVGVFSEPGRRRGRHLRAGAEPRGLNAPGPRRAHRRLVQGLRRPDPRHRHGAHRRAEGQSGQIRQVPARRSTGPSTTSTRIRRRRSRSSPSISRSRRTSSRRRCRTSAIRPTRRRREFMGTADQPGRVYEVFRETMDSTWSSAPRTWSSSRKTTSPPRSSPGEEGLGVSGSGARGTGGEPGPRPAARCGPSVPDVQGGSRPPARSAAEAGTGARRRPARAPRQASPGVTSSGSARGPGPTSRSGSASALSSSSSPPGWLATELELVQPQFLPSPLAVVEAWSGLFQNGYLRTSASASAGSGSRSWPRRRSPSRSAS